MSERMKMRVRLALLLSIAAWTGLILVLAYRPSWAEVYAGSLAAIVTGWELRKNLGKRRLDG